MAGYNQVNLFPPSASSFESGAVTWTATTNTTAPTSVTTYALEGTHSMQVKATAAGTTAVTSPREPVTTGSLYFLWVPFRSVAGSASRAITATISWYNVASGGTALSTSAVTSPTITAAALDWATVANLKYYPTLYATAPSGATYAEVKLSVSNMAANELIYFDAITFLLADPVSPGNLLTPQESYYEADLSAWAFTGSPTTTRTPGLISSRTTVGQYSGALSVTSAATVTKTSVRAVPVTAGTEYVYRESVAQFSAAPITPSIAWYNAASALVSTSTGPTTTPVVGKARGAVVVATAPAGAVTAKPSMSIAAPAGYSLAFDDAEFMPTSAATWPGNLLPYADSSFETTVPTADYTLTSGWMMGATPAPHFWFRFYEEGYFYAPITPASVGTTTRVMCSTAVSVTPGTAYSFGSTLVTLVNTPNAVASTMHRPVVVWLDASHTPLADEVPDSFATLTTTPSATVPIQDRGPYWSVRVAPESAAFAQVGHEIQHLDSNITSYGLDNVHIGPGDLEYTLSTDDSNGKLDLGIYYDPNDEARGAVSWSVQRFSTTTGDASTVRHETGDLSHTPWTASPVLIEDYEAPIGDSYWYMATWYDASGTVVDRLYTITCPGPCIADESYVWLKNPGVPGTNTQVMMAAPPTWARAARQTLTDVVGRRNPIPVFDVRGTRTADFTVYAWTADEADQVDALLDPGSCLLVQAAPGYGLPGNLYVSVGDAQRDPISDDARDEGWTYSLSVTEVDRPVGGLRGTAGRTWQDILDNYATWYDVFQDYPDWQAVLLGED